MEQKFNTYEIALIRDDGSELILSPLAKLSIKRGSGFSIKSEVFLPKVINSQGEEVLPETTIEGADSYSIDGILAEATVTISDYYSNIVYRENIKIRPVETYLFPTPPPPPSKLTQEEVKAERKKDEDIADQKKLEYDQTTTNSTTIDRSIPSSLKPKGVQKLPQIIFEQIKKIKVLIIPTLINIIVQKLGIRPIIVSFILKKDFSKSSIIKLSKNLGEGISPIDPDIVEQVFTGKINLASLSKEEKKRILLSLSPLLPQVCPPQPILKQIINTRNKLLGFLEKIAKILQIITIALIIASVGLKISKTLLKTLRGIKLSILIIGKALSTLTPPIKLPASLQSALSEIDVVAEKQKYNLIGTPKIDKIETAINSIAPPIAVISVTINTAIMILRMLDIFLLKCLIEQNLEENLTPISEDLQNINNRQEIAEESINEATYNGFIIEIEEVPFSPTVIRKKAVGINQSGIKLIETPLSFTTNPQTLIEELKFIIDRDDLKAY